MSDSLRTLRTKLARSADEAEIDGLLVDIGHLGTATDAILVAPYLAPHNPPGLVRRALQVLCSAWGLGANYREEILYWLRREPGNWDEFGEVRQMAIYCAGELANQATDHAILRLLVDLAQDEAENEDDRSDAILGIALGLGATWSELPGVSDEHSPQSSFGQLQLCRAEDLLSHDL